jgi:hypothetical protein
MISSDGGRTWRRGGEMTLDSPPGAMEPTLAELSDGDVLCLLRTTTGYHYQSRSADGGITWTQPVSSSFPGPNANGILLKLANGHLIFVWDKNLVAMGMPTPRYPLYVALSEDDGRTWPHQKMIQTTYGVKQLANHGAFQADDGTILVPTNHYQGVDDGRREDNRSLIGHLEMARFNEAWIRSQPDPNRWEQQPAPTGGIRLDPEGCLLATGAKQGDATVLRSKIDLPESCDIEYRITEQWQHPHTTGGLILGAYFQDNRPAAGLLVDRSRSSGHYDSTLVRLQVRGRQVRYSDSSGAQSDWIPLPPETTTPLSWGFYCLNNGVQGRVVVRDVRIVRPPPSE